MKVIRDSVAAVAQSFCWSWSGMLQPLTNLNKHPRSAACRAPPGGSVTACTGMELGTGEHLYNRGIVGDKMRMDGTAELTIVGWTLGTATVTRSLLFRWSERNPP